MIAVDLTGVGTLVLAVATFALAFFAQRQVRSSNENIAIARRALVVQERPELAAASQQIGPERVVSLSNYGTVTKPVGEVRVSAPHDGQVGLVSFELRNVGRGAAEIRRVRLMSLDSAREGCDALYWEPYVEDRVRRVVAAAETLPMDLAMTADKPSWFHRHLDGHTKLWVEVTYADLAGIEEHVRWFEIQARRGLSGQWFVAGVLRDKPDRVRNVPPAAFNPLLDTGELA